MWSSPPAPFLGLYIKRATPVTIRRTQRYLARGYFFRSKVTPNSMTVRKQNHKEFPKASHGNLTQQRDRTPPALLATQQPEKCSVLTAELLRLVEGLRNVHEYMQKTVKFAYLEWAYRICRGPRKERTDKPPARPSPACNKNNHGNTK